jgi:hypothetical protein
MMTLCGEMYISMKYNANNIKEKHTLTFGWGGGRLET